jgi:hypothetical protein
LDIQDIQEIASLIGDIGIIVGVPAIIGIGIKLYKRQMDILKEKNEFLMLTQFDNAVSMIKSQKSAYELEREQLEKEIRDLKQSRHQDGAELEIVSTNLGLVKNRISTLEDNENAINIQAYLITKKVFGLNLDDRKDWTDDEKNSFFSRLQIAARDRSGKEHKSTSVPDEDIRARATELAENRARELGLSQDFERWKRNKGVMSNKKVN